MDIRRILESFVFALVVAGAIGCIDYLRSERFFFVLEMEVSTVGTSSVFWDTGLDFNSQQSVSRQVVPGVSQSYSFALPSTRINSIRFDPIDSEAVIKIKRASIENSRGDILKRFTAQSFLSGWHHQIDRMDVLQESLVIQTAEQANDPIIIINDSAIDLSSGWMEFFIHRAWAYSAYVLLGFIFFLGLGGYLAPKLHKIFTGLSAYAVHNPKKTISFIGLTAAVVSCYPVVFFGKSFVSMGVGMWGLYSGPPWFPGLPVDALAENFRGSDTYAAAVSFFPNSTVQYESIFRDLEFPFWNRFLGGGVPLFGQSQSMIGDVLHWIPVSTGGSAIGWDIKFILSKAIFSIGMGLLIFRLTEKFSAALLIAISSCFLGFFAWRFNHPAFFVLTYAPWVVLQWGRMGEVLAIPDPRIRTCIFHGLMLAAVTWLQFNAGATKEGVITGVFMHGLGVASFLLQVGPKWGATRSLALALGVGLALVMIVAPYWLIFLDTLAKSYTNYDMPHAETYPFWALIGFFDNIFFERAVGQLWGPSVNLFVLCCMCSALPSLFNRQSWMVYVAWTLFALAMCAAFGVIPQQVLTAIPFIKNVHGVGNTFAVPMVVLSLIIAGYGIRDYLDASQILRKRLRVFSILIFLVLWFVFISGPSPDVLAFPPGFLVITERTVVLIMILLVVPLLMLSSQEQRASRFNFGLLILVLAFVGVHVRHGMHLFTGVNVIDRFVVNPTDRPDFSKTSSAIEFLKDRIKERDEPTRVIGDYTVLFPGIGSRLGLEGLVSAEAIRSQHFQSLLNLLQIPHVGGGWLYLIRNEQFADLATSLDMLGVDFVVGDAGVEMPEEMKLAQSTDLSVWERKSAWPRAFFVNKVVEVGQDEDILDALAAETQLPFAAVESTAVPSRYIADGKPYEVISARGYELSNNSTSFSVDATGPGVIVLGETYYPDDFIVQVNGEKVDYFRVNVAFKGIWVDTAGKYDVSFRYRPAKLGLALMLMAFGFALLTLSIRVAVVTVSRKHLTDSRSAFEGAV